MKTTLSNARDALRNALKNGAVGFASHAFDGMVDEGVDTFVVLDELHVALASGDVKRNAGGRGRWIAFGLYLAIVFEVVRPGVVVITVFEAQGR